LEVAPRTQTRGAFSFVFGHDRRRDVVGLGGASSLDRSRDFESAINADRADGCGVLFKVERLRQRLRLAERQQRGGRVQAAWAIAARFSGESCLAAATYAGEAPICWLSWRDVCL
jgi:hypothetical protein